jgi:hypothetical protein
VSKGGTDGIGASGRRAGGPPRPRQARHRQLLLGVFRHFPLLLRLGGRKCGDVLRLGGCVELQEADDLALGAPTARRAPPRAGMFLSVTIWELRARPVASRNRGEWQSPR